MNSNREIVVDFSGNDEFLFADGFDGAIIGHCSNGVVYSAPTIIQILQDKDNMTEEEALDYYYYNIEGASIGEYTPIYMWDNYYLVKHKKEKVMKKKAIKKKIVRKVKPITFMDKVVSGTYNFFASPWDK